MAEEKLEVNKEVLLEVLGTLSALRKDFPYTLLLHVLTPEQVMSFLDVFGGTKVEFPTYQELLECVTFSVVRKYENFERAPKELTNGLSKSRYTELLRKLEPTDI